MTSNLQTENAENSTSEDCVKNPNPPIPDHIKIPSDGTDEWEIDMKRLKFGKKVASGTYGDLYVFLLVVILIQHSHFNNLFCVSFIFFLLFFYI
jgi:hypothetical protein